MGNMETNLDSTQPDWLDTQAYSHYLQTLEPRAQGIVQRIVNNTVYLSKARTIELLLGCIQTLHKMVNKYYLFVPTGKIGSEHWLLLELLSLLHPLGVVRGTEDPQQLDESIPIVIIDDAIYSSVNMCMHIDEWQFAQQGRYGKKPKNRFYLLVAVTSCLVSVQVSEQFGAIIIPALNLQSKRIRNLLGEKYDYDYLYDQFGCETDTVLPLIFEHKIANAFGSYQFYHKIVKNKPDRSHIDRLVWRTIEERLTSCDSR